MATQSKFNKAIMLDAGSDDTKTPTYGSYLSGGTFTPSIPTPGTPPSYSAGLTGQPTTSYLSPVGNPVRNTVWTPDKGSSTYGSWMQNTDQNTQKSYTGAWAGSEPIDSYEEYLRKRESIYGTMRDEQTQYNDDQLQKALDAIEALRQAAVTAAENQRAAAEQRADIERERGIVDARSAYEQNKASYGANAEALGSMGLSGGGYSDYLNSKAYAQQRAETQAANAQADVSKREARYAEDQARLLADSEYYQNIYDVKKDYSDRKYEIDTTYQENLLNNDETIGAYRQGQAEKAEAEAKQAAAKAEEEAQYARAAYTELLAGANNGSYTIEQLEQLAADYGLSEEQKQSLINAVGNAYVPHVTADTTDSQIQKLVDAGDISETSVEALKERRADLAKDDIYQYIKGGDSTTARAKADDYYKDGVISPEVYQAFYYDDSIKNIDSVTTAADASRLVDELKLLEKAGKISSGDYNSALNYLYKKVVKVPTSGSYTTAPWKNIFGGEPISQAMYVTIDGTQYHISTDVTGSSGNFVDADTGKLLSNVVGESPKNGTLASIGDTIYIYRTRLNNGSGWVKVNRNSYWDGSAGTDKGFYDAYKNQAEAQPLPKAPASTATNSAFRQIQSYIDANELREGDRGRWGDAFKAAGLLELYNTLTAEEKAALIGKR